MDSMCRLMHACRRLHLAAQVFWHVHSTAFLEIMNLIRPLHYLIRRLYRSPLVSHMHASSWDHHVCRHLGRVRYGEHSMGAALPSGLMGSKLAAQLIWTSAMLRRAPAQQLRCCCRSWQSHSPQSCGGCPWAGALPGSFPHHPQR
jgi:hypothetical protein